MILPVILDFNKAIKVAPLYKEAYADFQKTEWGHIEAVIEFKDYFLQRTL